ncbi:response regulator [Agaribacter flavus]|uniref:Response regulator n=1 Tax=Agaribacter flavus TaxID=1902781 RepID=A0ABV7FNL8_9ALTE
MNSMSHLLLVEDNQDDYEAVVRSLKKNHFMNPVKWCKNGQDALDYIYKNNAYNDNTDASLPDLILLDLNMPGIDGRHVLQQLKSDKNTRSIPVVVLTTSNDAKDIEKCYDLGASTYIQKPVDFEGLTQAIRTMKDYWFGVAILPRKDL